LLIVSCREKENCVNCEENLEPPLGIAFSVPQGDVSFFRMRPMEVVRTAQLSGWAVVASEVSTNAQWLAVADGAADRVALLKLPELRELSGAVVGGAPLDVDVDVTGELIYALTSNGAFWRYSVGSGTFDTLEVRLQPRRFALRPTDDREAWVVCGGNNTVHVVDLGQFSQSDTLTLQWPPTDIEFSRDGLRAYIALRGDSGYVAVFDASSRRMIGQHACGLGTLELAVSDDERLVAASDSATGLLNIWETASGRQWQVPVGRCALRTRFAHGSHACYVMSLDQTRLLRVEIGENGPGPSDTLSVLPMLRDFVLWEAPR
jgi:hypothetical protein